MQAAAKQMASHEENDTRSTQTAQQCWVCSLVLQQMCKVAGTSDIKLMAAQGSQGHLESPLAAVCCL